MDVAPASPPAPPAVCAANTWGPYGIGLRTFDYVDAARGDRPLPTLVYYPTDAPGDLDACWADFLARDRMERRGLPIVCAVADAGPAASGAPFPLVVVSHGSGSQKEAHAFAAEYLATHGFVVAVPDHTGNVGWGEASPIDLHMTATRAWDVVFVLDRVLLDAAPGGALAGLVDPDRIGVAGHSWGGHTALSVAGVTYSWDVIAADCAAGTEPDDWYCPLLADRAAFEERLPDPRVKAVVTWAHDCGHMVAGPACQGAAGVASRSPGSSSSAPTTRSPTRSRTARTATTAPAGRPAWRSSKARATWASRRSATRVRSGSSRCSTSCAGPRWPSSAGT